MFQLIPSSRLQWVTGGGRGRGRGRVVRVRVRVRVSVSVSVGIRARVRIKIRMIVRAKVRGMFQLIPSIRLQCVGPPVPK